MNKEIIKVSDMQRFVAACFDRLEESEKVTRKEYWMPGFQGFRIYPTLWEEAQRPTYKTSQRFLDNSDPRCLGANNLDNMNRF